MELLFENGIVFVVASGRQYFNMVKYFAPIHDRIYYLADNGTLLMHRDEQIYLDGIDREKAHYLIDKSRSIPDVDIIYSCRNSAYRESNKPRFVNEVSNYYARLKYVEDLKTVDEELIKFTLCDFNDSATHSYPYFKEEEDDFTISVAGELWLDITRKGANKGTAVSWLMEQMNINAGEIVTFGDYLNDLELMKITPNSYAMKNAQPEIIEAAGHITELTNNEGGVTHQLKKLLG